MDMELRKFGRIRINELDEAIQFIVSGFVYIEFFLMQPSLNQCANGT